MAIISMFPKDEYKIMFESSSDFCDNSRAFYEYLIKNNYSDKYKYVWCVANPSEFKAKSKSIFATGKNTKFTSFRKKKYYLQYLFHIATAKTIIYSHATPPFIDTKKQTVACVWHGTPLKKMVYKDTGFLPFSFILSASNWCKQSLCECFRIPDSMVLNLGYPRCDLMLEQNDSLLKLSIKRENYKKILLWLPTFRQSAALEIVDSEKTQTGLPLMKTAEDLKELNVSLYEKNMFMIIKLHPLQDLDGVDLVKLSNIKMITNDELDNHDIQLYHLLSNADVLVTDYSSVYFDYLLLNRPICFTLDDIDIYRQKRGFVTSNPCYLMPGAQVKSKAGFECFLNDMKNDKDDFEKARLRVCKIANEHTDNQSRKRLADELKLHKN